jgi:carbon starvation protein CstA
MKGLAAIGPFMILLAACGATSGGTATQTPTAVTQAPTPTLLPGASLTGLQSSYTITDTDTLDLAGSTVPNATVTGLLGAVAAVTVTADAQGNFTLQLTGIPMGTSTLSVSVNSPAYSTGEMTISVTRNVSEAGYKASASSMPYDQLIKDPASLAGTIVTYQAQVFQYDTNTTTSHFIASVTNEGYGFWDDDIWADVDPSVAANVCADTVIKFWGSVVGPYTYTTTSNGQLTIPEINIQYLDVISGGC